MRRAIKKLCVYWQELVFGSHAACSWADVYRLMYHTLRFHIRNGFGCACDERATFAVTLRIDGERPTTLTLRPFAGDLFVLYEVLAFKAYHIACSLLPPDNVRTIIDCGANVGITSLFLLRATPMRRSSVWSRTPRTSQSSRPMLPKYLVLRQSGHV